MRIPRRKQLVSILLCPVLTTAGFGCRTAHPRADESPPMSSRTLTASSGIKAELKTDHNDFRAKVERGQEAGVHLDMGRGYESRGQPDIAAAEYQKALEVLDRPGRDGESSHLIVEQKATAHRRLAELLDRQGRFAQSDLHYKAALKVAPNDPKVWNNAGYSYYIQGRWEEAERTLRTALRLAPEDSKIATNLGLTLTALGKEPEAFKLLSKPGGTVAAHQNMGYVLASTGRTAEAADHYRKALVLQPDLVTVKNALAKLGESSPSLLAEAPTDSSLAKANVEPQAPRVKRLFEKTGP
jgi:tetratricopeptide (TPR) repeat protein